MQIPRSASNLFPKSECRAPGLVLVRQAPVHSSSSKIKHFYSFEVSFIKASRYLFTYLSPYLQEDVHTLAQTPRISIDDTDSNHANSHTSLPNPGYNR